MSNWNTVFSGAAGAYSRSVHVAVGEWECNVCKETKRVLDVDTSDSEYESFSCCGPCFLKLLDGDK